MKVLDLSQMTGGWFVGNFEPTAFVTNAVEVAVKKYQIGDYEPLHYHKIATEITLIVDGRVKMNGVEYGPNSILVIEPNIPTDFLALTDVVTTVVKIPGANNDKYPYAPSLK